MIPRSLPVRVTLAQFKALKAKAAKRAGKRHAKRRVIAAARGIRSTIKTGNLKKQLVRMLGLLDRKLRGPFCRIHGEPCLGTIAYHLVPQQRGDATRLLPENVVWACQGANYGEFRNRSLYRQKHVDLFGAELIERLEEIAGEFKKYSRAELFELREKLKAQLEAQ